MIENKISYLISTCYRFSPYKLVGKIISSSGPVFTTSLSRASIGAGVSISTTDGNSYLGEVISLKDTKAWVMPHVEVHNINSETLVTLKNDLDHPRVSDHFLGRILDYMGTPIDDKGEIEGPFSTYDLFGEPINPLKRPPISQPLSTGIRAIDGFLTLGKGQRIGVMAGSGVGKSVLLGMFAKNSKADVNVIALIGERGREVLEFVKRDLGEEGLKKSVVIVGTNDSSPLVRIRAAYYSMAIAEYFRDQGHDVNYMMDSVTRFCMAYREIALAIGEIPGQRGHPPSVFAKLPKLLERCGTKENSGTITGIFTVLVEGGDMDEPVADSVRSIVDGHIILSRELATLNHFPAISVLESVSRVMSSIITKEHKVVTNYLRDLFAAYESSKDLINVGAYVQGQNARVDKAMRVYEDIINFLRQDEKETPLEDSIKILVEIARKAEIDPVKMAQEEAAMRPNPNLSI